MNVRRTKTVRTAMKHLAPYLAFLSFGIHLGCAGPAVADAHGSVKRNGGAN